MPQHVERDLTLEVVADRRKLLFRLSCKTSCFKHYDELDLTGFYSL